MIKVILLLVDPSVLSRLLMIAERLIIVWLIYVHQVSPAVMQGHKLGCTGWLSLCMVCRVRGVS